MRDFAGTVRESADIVRVIADYVALKGTGHSVKGLCPFHSEKTPSFWVHRDKRFYHCFGCGAGGDVFEFVMRIERASFPEALRIVAEKCGVPVPADTGAWGGGKQAEERQELLDLYSRAAAHYHSLLGGPDAGLARQALAKRQVSAESTARFQLGYAPQITAAR
jgi:DNA primase